ncbi:hypothetical protein QOZ80_8BG0648230 [Eleusine coracana subsp. coracana]|nr:hypothetical protein QOZ80_8BG0648230 [Eleusine coracana subsp. coracana]
MRPLPQPPLLPSAIHSGSRRHQQDEAEDHDHPSPVSTSVASPSPAWPTTSCSAGLEALDLQYSPSPDLPSTGKERDRRPPEDKAQGRKEKTEEAERPRPKSVLVIPPQTTSYRDVVVGARKEGITKLSATSTRSLHLKTAGGRKEEGCEEVKARYWWRRGKAESHTNQKRNIRGRENKESKFGQGTPFADWFRRRAAGRCFRCLASDHKVAQCRDPPKCILCFRSGHKAKWCRSGHQSPRPNTTTYRVRAERVSFKKAAEESREALKSTSEKSSGTGDMEDLLPGAPHLRPDRVEACIKRSSEMEAQERELRKSALLAVVADASAVPSCKQVEEAVRSGLLANKPRNNTTIEQQAIQLLMKKSGFVQQEGETEADAQDKFTEQFVNPIKPDMISSLHDMFGMDGAQSNDLHAVAVQAGIQEEAEEA